jgi:hypothetical protein
MQTTTQKTQKKITEIDFLNSRKYDPNFIPPKDEICFTIDNKIIGTKGNYICFSGKPKNGKSTYVSAAIASFIKGVDVFKMSLKFKGENSKVALFDTESGTTTFYKHINQIKTLAGVTDEVFTSKLDAYRLRGASAAYIIQCLKKHIENNPNCKCYVIDGLLDLITDFNNITECKILTDWLKEITEIHNLLFIVVIHLGRKENMTLGHIGAFADRYAQSTLKVEKNVKENCFELTASLLRESDDFDAINIRRGEDGLFYDVEVEQPQMQRTYKDWNDIELRKAASVCVKEIGTNYGELIDECKERFNIGVNACKALIKTWIDNKIIYKNVSGLYIYNTGQF